MNTSNEKNTHGLIKFIGFGGLITLLTLAATAGALQRSVADLAHSEEKMETSLDKMNTTLSEDRENTTVQGYQITAIDRRVDKLEAK